MTLAEQTRLIDDLIRENPDVTIKDYLEASKEIDGIVKATSLMQLLNEKSDLCIRNGGNVNITGLNFYRGV